MERKVRHTKSDHQLKVYSDITQLIASPENPTPLVALNKINPNEGMTIYLKLERYNPFGSIKDRIAMEMLSAMDIKDKTIVEPSSGNTGIALTCVANALGIPIEIVVPDGIPDEKKIILRFLGAKVSEADDSLCPIFPNEGARGLVKAMIESPALTGKYVSPNQYENEMNVQAHYRNTGPEIWKQTNGEIEYFFAALGTCGTITGVGKYLKERNPAIKVIAVEPSMQYHELPGMKRISDLDEKYVPGILDRTLIDEIVEVTDDDAYTTAIELARKDGIPAGPTTGAIVKAAVDYAKSNKGLAVAISPDDAFKYASFYNNILQKHAEHVEEKEHDLSGYICPASKVMATEIIDGLNIGEATTILIGDEESLKNITRELKIRGIKPDLEQKGENRFALSITK
jgi:cysteine synthase A/cysteine synthase B